MHFPSGLWIQQDAQLKETNWKEIEHNAITDFSNLDALEY